jgi:hypothetical protein
VPTTSADANAVVGHFSTGTSTPDQQPDALDAVPPTEEKLELPHTPKTTPTDSAKSNSPTPLSSSKVTINLRRVAEPTPESTEGTSPSPTGTKKAPPILSNVTSDGQLKMPTMEQTRPSSGEETPQMSDSASPPVELITISDDEDGESDNEMAYSVDDGVTGISGNELSPPDPTPLFPYIQRNEEPSLPLLRFINHFKAGMSR